MRYEVVFKKEIGFHAEVFDAKNDEVARRKVRDLKDRAKSQGKNFMYPLTLKKFVRVR